jgi:Protein of unknown function (DUF3489)
MEMTTFTINDQNEIVAFANPEEAAATTQTPFDSFISEQQLAELAASWPAERLAGIWNSLPGVVGLRRLPETKEAKQRWAKRIWQRIQKLGDSAEPKPELPAEGKPAPKAKGSARVAKGAPPKAKAGKKSAPAKPVAKGKKAAKTPEAGAPREGSKTAQVVAMLQRKNGATITQIMEAMGWLRHTVRGFMAGAMKKAGYTVESFKPDDGERSYRLPK